MEHHGIEAHSATTPKTQKHKQTEIKIPSAADRWIQAKSNTVQLSILVLGCGYGAYRVGEAGLGSTVVGFGIGGFVDPLISC